MRKDTQTVHSDGSVTQPLIGGVIMRPAVTHIDERGELTEVFSPAWGVDDLPMVYAYQAMVRPRKCKAWLMHQLQQDRLFFNLGFFRVGLFDDRPASPTRGMLNVFFFSERNRTLITIPPGVWHGVQNVGLTDAYYFNLPTRAYDHADPDKFRLPVKNDLIPFAFDDSTGW